MTGTCRIFMIASIIFLSNSAQAQLSKFEGIWQGVQNPDEYYSIHIEGDKVVFIDLAGLEESGETLNSAYYGSIVESASGTSSAKLSVLVKHANIPAGVELLPTSATDLIVFWCFSGLDCVAGLAEQIRKVF
jgi:hypothetical protein